VLGVVWLSALGSPLLLRLALDSLRWRTLALVRTRAHSPTHALTHALAGARVRATLTHSHPRARACRTLAQAKPTRARYIHSRHALTYAPAHPLTLTREGHQGYFGKSAGQRYDIVIPEVKADLMEKSSTRVCDRGFSFTRKEIR
jgi:hypothetical protein